MEEEDEEEEDNAKEKEDEEADEEVPEEGHKGNDEELNRTRMRMRKTGRRLEHRSEESRSGCTYR